MINEIDHYVRLTRDVTIPAMQVHKTVVVARIPVLTKQLNVITEALPHREEVKGMEVIPSYETFKQGGNRITIGLNNTTQEKIVLKKGTKITVPPFGVGECPIEPQAGNGNSITAMFSGPPKPGPTPERLNELFEKLDLKGIVEWSEAEQAEVHELMTEFQHLFALSDLELGCTSLVKHKIRVDNPVPFKERY